MADDPLKAAIEFHRATVGRAGAPQHARVDSLQIVLLADIRDALLAQGKPVSAKKPKTAKPST